MYLCDLCFPVSDPPYLTHSSQVEGNMKTSAAVGAHSGEIRYKISVHINKRQCKIKQQLQGQEEQHQSTFIKTDCLVMIFMNGLIVYKSLKP